MPKGKRPGQPGKKKRRSPGKQRRLNERKEIREKTRSGRLKSQSAIDHWYIQDRPLKSYKRIFAFKKEPENNSRFTRFLDKLAKSKERVVNVLDGGAGYGIASSEIKEFLVKAGRKVYVEGIALAKPKDYEAKRKWAAHRLQRKKPFMKLDAYTEKPAEWIFRAKALEKSRKGGRKFDLIMSVAGVGTYTKHPAETFRGMILALKPHGQLFVTGQIKPGFIEELKQIVKEENRRLDLEKAPQYETIFNIRIY